jgi:hypothetical protein
MTEGALENPHEKTNFATKPRERITYGETLPNDSVLDLVDAGDPNGLSLLSWHANQAEIQLLIEVDGIIYRPPTLHQSIRLAMRFPGGVSEFGTISQLFAKVASICQEHLGLSEAPAAFATCWILSTWVPELVQVLFTLCISGGSTHQTRNALRLFGALCRRSLLVAELSRRLPLFLQPTLLANHGRLSEKDCALWRAANCRSLFVARTGSTVCSLGCAKAVVMQPDDSLDMWGPEAMLLELPLAETTPLSDQLLANIASAIQPQLELFRLRLLSGPGLFAPGTHPLSRFALARNLAVCIPEDEGIVRSLTPLLETHERMLLAERLRDPRVAILQAVWAPSHKQKEMPVGEITNRVNAILQSLSNSFEFNSKEIGWKLRSLNLSTNSDGKRKILRFSGENRLRIHQLLREYHLDLPFLGDCADCRELQVNE